MALNNVFTSLNGIRPFKTTWRIQVKIVHSWTQYTSYTGETIEMILADLEGTLIHATIKKQQLAKYQRLINSGEWRIIENFTLAKAMGKFRATKHPYRMSLMNSTIVTPCPSLSDDMYLDLATFDALSDEAQCPENVLVDVIGHVVNVGEMKTHDVNNKITKKLEFELRNTNDERLAGTLWGRFAETLMAACENSGDKNVICLLRFAKITSFKGVRSISNAFDMSLLLINPEYAEAVEFVQNLPQDGLTLTLQVHVPKEQNVVKKVEYYNRFPRSTIHELLYSSEVGKFKIMCTIFAIDTDFSWYYFTCLKCSKTAYVVPKVEDDVVKKPKQTFFWCGNCRENTTRVVPRYKLILRVMDSTGETKVMLFEKHATQVVCCSAFELLEGHFDEIQDPTNMPQALKNLVGKTFQFLVSVEKDNISDGNDTYKVSYAWVGLDSDHLENHEDSDVHDDLTTVVSVDQEALLLTNSNDISEGLVTATATPSSKRKDDGSDDSLDQSSSSKKICVPSISDDIANEESDGGKAIVGA